MRLRGGFADQEKAGQIHAQDALPFLRGELIDVDAVRHGVDAGVVDEDVEPAMPREDLAHRGLDLRFIGDVHAQRDGAGRRFRAAGGPLRG